MIRLSRYFVPRVNYALLALCCAAFVAVNLWLVMKTHEARRQSQAWCRAAQRVLIEHKPVLRHTVPLADDCLTLARMRGEEREP